MSATSDLARPAASSDCRKQRPRRQRGARRRPAAVPAPVDGEGGERRRLVEVEARPPARRGPARVEPGLVRDHGAVDAPDPPGGDLGREAVQVGRLEGRIAESAQPEVSVPDIADERSAAHDLGVEAVAGAEQRPARRRRREASDSRPGRARALAFRSKTTAPVRRSIASAAVRAGSTCGTASACRSRVVSVASAARAGAATSEQHSDEREAWAEAAPKIGPAAHAPRRSRADNRGAVDDRLPGVMAEIRSLLDLPAGAELPPRADVENTLTSGYAYALELERERLRIERSLRALVRSTAASRPARDAATLSRSLAEARSASSRASARCSRRCARKPC